jgi:hypothetical protein
VQLLCQVPLHKKLWLVVQLLDSTRDTYVPTYLKQKFPFVCLAITVPLLALQERTVRLTLMQRVELLSLL